MKINHPLARELLEAGASDEQVAHQFGCSASYVRMIRMGRIKLRSEGGPTQTRQVQTPHFDKPRPPLFETSAAVVEQRTVYPQRVKDPTDANVLKSGYNNTKLGKIITKGKWKTYPIFSLSLEERATCPRSCEMYLSCYGNSMNNAIRYRHGPALERQVAAEVVALGVKYPNGFVIRLHALGDFYSVEYVKLWSLLLDLVPSLYVFGYTARLDRDDPIATELGDLIWRRWDRFAVRFSNGPGAFRNTVNIESPKDRPIDAIQCPQQTGKTEVCATCGLCWATTRRIAFLRH